MASPPASNSSAPSPLLPNLSLPKKRPPTGPPPINTSGSASKSPIGSEPVPHKRRKPSTASNISLTSHPLRQTSFPPEGIAVASPATSIGGSASAGVRWTSRSPSVESASVAGASASGVGQKRRRRGGGGGRGGSSVSGKKGSFTSAAPSVTGAAGEGTGAAADARSLVGGRAGSAGGSLVGGGGGGGMANAAGDDADDEDDDAGLVDTVMEGGGKMDEASVKQEREHLSMLIDAFDQDQTERYEIWRRVRLKKETVRRLANQTLSQSVPASVVTTINGFTKIFIGELIERARDVQTEWLAAAELSRLEKEHMQSQQQQLQQQKQQEKLQLSLQQENHIASMAPNTTNGTTNGIHASKDDDSPMPDPELIPDAAPTTTNTTASTNIPITTTADEIVNEKSNDDKITPDITTTTTPSDPTEMMDLAPDTTSTANPPQPTIPATTTTATITTTANPTAISPEPPYQNSNLSLDPTTNRTNPTTHPFETQPQFQLQPLRINLHDHMQTLLRPPLTPDHLREALRRYKKVREGGGAGFQGLSLQGRERVAPRMGGRRLFK